MLHSGRIALNEHEEAAVEEFLAAHPDVDVSLTRRNPGESGPLLVHAGDDTFEVDEIGGLKVVT